MSRYFRKLKLRLRLVFSRFRRVNHMYEAKGFIYEQEERGRGHEKD
jgi:hypothetical protein